MRIKVELVLTAFLFLPSRPAPAATFARLESLDSGCQASGGSLLAAPSGGWYLAGSYNCSWLQNSPWVVVHLDTNLNVSWARQSELFPPMTYDDRHSLPSLDANGRLRLDGWTDSWGEFERDWSACVIDETGTLGGGSRPSRMFGGWDFLPADVVSTSQGTTLAIGHYQEWLNGPYHQLLCEWDDSPGKIECQDFSLWDELVALGALATATGGGHHLVGQYGEDPLIMRLDAANAIVWQKSFDLGPDRCTSSRPLEVAGGDLIVPVACWQGSTRTPWLLRVGAGGTLVGAWRFDHSSSLGVVAVRDAGAGSLVLLLHESGTPTRAALVALDATMSPLWGGAFDHGTPAGLERAPDGDWLVSGSQGDALLLLKVHPDGTMDAGCSGWSAWSTTITAATVGETLLNIVPQPDFDLERGGVGARIDDPGIVTRDACSPCLARPAAVTGLRLARSGGDVTLAWEAVATASGYNIWMVDSKENINRARQGDWIATGVEGCSPPDPAPDLTCVDPGGVARTPPLVLYQVRARCSPAGEGE